MAYGAYLIDQGDHIGATRMIAAETDAEALKQAEQWVDGCDVEVWHGRILVPRLSGKR